MAFARPLPRRSVSCREVAERLRHLGAGEPLSPDDGILAYAIVRAFEGTGTRMGDVPMTSDDLDEIRYEHRLLVEGRRPAERPRAEAALQ